MINVSGKLTPQAFTLTTTCPCAAFGDGIHMGYNFYANAAGTPVLVHPDGGTSRITTGYGYMAFATGAIGQPPTNRVDIEDSSRVGVRAHLRRIARNQEQIAQTHRRRA